jgi:hypothetical protein
MIYIGGSDRRVRDFIALPEDAKNKERPIKQEKKR